jgi:hypothetical protein
LGVESWREVDVEPLNRQIETAADLGRTWPLIPALVALEVAGVGSETRNLSLSQRTDSVEVPDSAVVILAEDNLLDDSIRGVWHRVVLLRQPDGTWRVAEMRRAFRCRRGGSIDRYAADLCP